MAKRELIAKNDVFELIEEVENISWVNCFKTGVDTLPTTNEEEIVKSYLEKLKSKIRDRNTLNFTNWQCDIISDKTYKQNFRMYEEMLSIVNTLIDDLLTEKGAE